MTKYEVDDRVEVLTDLWGWVPALITATHGNCPANLVYQAEFTARDGRLYTAWWREEDVRKERTE